MALLPQVVDAVTIPVIAAGGIADSRGVVAAFALGAQGVQIGSLFVVAKECNAHQNYKDMVLKAKDRSTVVTGHTTGHPVRVLKNLFTRQFEELERQNAPVEELEKLGAGKLRLAVVDGDIEYGSVMIGQIAGMIDEQMTCVEIMQKLMGNVDAVVARLPK